MNQQRTDPAEVQLSIVKDFVNTVELDEDDGEQLTSPKALGSWLRERGLLESSTEVNEPELDQTLVFREALRDLLSRNAGEAIDDSAIDVVNEQAARSSLRIRFEDADRPQLVPSAKGVNGALGRLLATIYKAMADGTWSRLKACRKHSCRWAFYDRSRNRSRSWCSMAVCGNQVKVSRFRQRQPPDEDERT